MTLYELNGEYLRLMDMASDPEIDWDAFEDTLEALTGDIEDKADGYAKVIRSLEAETAAIDEEIKRLTAQKTVRKNSVDRMKAALKTTMELTGKTKFKTDLFSFGIRKNPAAVVMDEQYIENIPDEYLIQQDPKIDRAKIKEDLKAGKDLNGIAHLEQGTSLSIK